MIDRMKGWGREGHDYEIGVRQEKIILKLKTTI
jgi:hypothetical protein